MKSRFSTELILYYDLYASHSLDTREELHEHLWKVELHFTGEPIRGRIIDLPLLEEKVDHYLKPLQKQNLNGAGMLTPEARDFPTCETLGESFFLGIEKDLLPPLRESLNPTLKLLSIKITLAEGDGRVYGSALIRQA